MSEIKNILGADISSNVNDLVLGVNADVTADTIADLSVGVCKDDDCLPVEIIDPCTANTSCAIDTDICTDDSTCTGDYEVCDAAPPNPCVDNIINVSRKSCYLKINPVGSITNEETFELLHYDIIPILSSSTSAHNTIMVTCEGLNVTDKRAMTLTDDYAYINVIISPDDAVYSNIETGYTAVQTTINIPGHSTYSANMDWFVVEYMINYGDDTDISDILTATINVDTTIYEITFRDESIISDLAPFELSFKHEGDNELSLHYYVYKSGNTIDKELLEYNLITPYDDFNVTIENGIDNIVTKSLSLYEKESHTIYLDDLISASTSINGAKVLTLNYLKEMIPNIDVENVSKITDSNVCLNPSLSKYTYVPFGCNTYPEDEKQLMRLNNIKAFSSRRDAAVMGIDSYQQMIIYYTPVYMYVTQRRTPKKNIIKYSFIDEIENNDELQYNITVEKNLSYRNFLACYNIPDENEYKRIEWLGNYSSININIANNSSSIKAVSCEKNENEVITTEKSLIYPNSTGNIKFTSSGSSILTITNDGTQYYKLNFTVNFNGMIYLGFKKGIKTTSDACFMPIYEGVGPDWFYDSFGSITNSEYDYEGTNILNIYGFKIGNKALKLGELYTNSWFKEAGLSLYNNYYTVNNIYLLPFYSNTSGLDSYLTRWTTVKNNSTERSFTIPVYINNTSDETSSYYPYWKEAIIYYNASDSHSGYNTLGFNIKYDIINDTFTIDSKFKISDNTTYITTTSSSTSYDSTDNCYVINKTITINNPVFRMGNEEWGD